MVVVEGEHTGGIFIVAYGRLRVYREDGGRELFVTELGPGDTVGEGEVLTGTAATASVRAVRDSLVLHLPAEGLERVTEWHPDVPLRMAKRLLRRSVVTGHVRPERSAESVRTLAIVPAGPEPVPAEFVQGLLDALRSFGTVRHISSRTIDAELGEGTAEIPMEDARNGRVVAWLQATERAHSLVLYESDPAPTVWTHALPAAGRSGGAGRPLHCTGVAERHRAAAALRGPADHDGPPGAGVAARRVGATDPAPTAGSRPARSTPTTTSALGDAGHYGRLARLVTGRAVGVVFGGGAHGGRPTSAWSAPWRRPAFPSTSWAGPASGRSPPSCAPWAGTTRSAWRSSRSSSPAG